MLTRFITQLFVFSYLSLSLVHARIYPTRFPNTTWDDFNWRLQTLIPDQGHYQARASIANGYIGINVAALGPFFEVDSPVNGDMVNGWPLFDRRQSFATVAGFWNEQPHTNGTNFPWLDQYGGESVISGIPHWAGLVPSCKGATLDANTDLSEITGFSSTFDYRAATLSWQYTWTPPNCQAFEIEYQMFANKLSVHQAAVRLKITPSRDEDIFVYDVLEGDCASRTDFVNKGFEANTATIWTAVTPQNLHNISAWVYSTMVGDRTVDSKSVKLLTDKSDITGRNASSIAQSVRVHLRAGRATRITKFVGVASSDAIKTPQKTAKEASLAGSQMGYLNMLEEHMKEWHTIMPSDSVDQYQDPATGDLKDNKNGIEQQILAITSPFYILQNTIGQNAIAKAGNAKLNRYSISVGGLTSDSYAGMVFWDADVWMQPGLVLSFPDAMRQVADYRLDRRPQALANIDMAFSSSQKNTKFSPDAAAYSWTSSRYGNCTDTGPCFDYEYHVNGDIALEVENYWLVTGDTPKFQKDYFPIFNSAAQFYSDLLVFNKSTKTYMLKNATDPDEFANSVDNPGYTMLLAQTIMNRANQYRKQFGMPTKAKWTRQANNIEIPQDSQAGIHLEYTGMNGGIEVKQADVVLIYDFLHFQSKLAQGDLAYYAGKQSQAGPAMTYGVFSIVASEVVPSGCSSYTYDLYGTQPYVRGPWFQFSEQLVDDFQTNGGFHPAYPFLTGMGGANRVAPYGYLGLRLMPSSFNINPNLPPQIDHLNLRTIYWQGYAIKAILSQSKTTITRLHRSLPNANPAFANKPIPVTIGQNSKIHMLQPGATLSFETRLPGLVKTVPGNLAQCVPIVPSTQAFLPGQFPQAAIDGSVTTKWQPTLARDPSSITISLGSDGIVPITGFTFDWAQAVPESFTVTLANVSDPSPAQMKHIASSNNVQVSSPYVPKTVNAVVPYASNTTTVKLSSPAWGGMFATLTIQGNHADGAHNATGATVAEWAIIAQDSKSVAKEFFSHS